MGVKPENCGVTETERKEVFQEGGPGRLHAILRLCAILLQSSGKHSKATVGLGHLEVMATLPRAISTERGDRSSEGVSGIENKM